MCDVPTTDTGPFTEALSELIRVVAAEVASGAASAQLAAACAELYATGRLAG